MFHSHSASLVAFAASCSRVSLSRIALSALRCAVMSRK